MGTRCDEPETKNQRVRVSSSITELQHCLHNLHHWSRSPRTTAVGPLVRATTQVEETVDEGVVVVRTEVDCNDSVSLVVAAEVFDTIVLLLPVHVDVASTSTEFLFSCPCGCCSCCRSSFFPSSSSVDSMLVQSLFPSRKEEVADSDSSEDMDNDEDRASDAV